MKVFKMGKKQKFVVAFFLGLSFVFAAGISQGAINCPGTLPAGTQGTPYSYTFTGTGGNGGSPWWYISFGSLPPGLSLTSQSLNSVNLTGTPTSSGTYTFAIRHREPGVDPICWSTLVINPPSCSFVGGNTGSISFGNMDPTTNASVAATVTTPVRFICSSGLAYTVTVNPSSGWQISSGSNTLGYSLGVATSGTSTGAAVDLFTTGSTIAPGQYVNAPAGNYSNTSAVTVTISWTGGSITASLPIGGVTATVINECAVAGSPSVSFGTLDAVTHAGGAAATVTPPSIRCTMGASVSVTDNGGLNFSGTPRLKDASTNYIPYNINYSGSLTGSGGLTDVGGSGTGRLSLSASMPANALDNAPAGTYSDTVTLTISY